MSSMRYLGGSATAVVRGDFALLVDPVSQQRINELWTLAGTEPEVVGLLDVLGTDGIAAMPRFAAALRHGEQFRVVVRGTFAVDVETPAGTLTCDGEGVATWSERAFPVTDVIAVRLATGEAAGATALPIEAGVVNAAAVFSESGSSSWQAPSAPAREPEPALDLEPPLDPEPPPEPPTAEQVAPPPPATVQGAPTPGPVAGDHDDHTMTPAEFAALQSRAAAGRPGAVMPPGPVTPPPLAQVLLRFSTGRDVVVDRPVVVGRSPRAVNTSSAMLPTLVVLDDPYVSGTHLEFAMVDGNLMGTDRSTNGTLMGAPGQSPAPMMGGRPTRIATGSVLHVTDQITITVVAP